MNEYNYEIQLLDYINQDRNLRGLPSLEYCEELAQVARKHTNEQRDGGDIYHNSPITGSLSDRLKRDGILYKSAAENVSRTISLISAHQGYMKSPGHKKNILGDFSHVGLGVSRDKKGVLFTTEVFSKKFQDLTDIITPQTLHEKLNTYRLNQGLSTVSFQPLLSIDKMMVIMKEKPMNFVKQFPQQAFLEAVSKTVNNQSYRQMQSYVYGSYDGEIFPDIKPATSKQVIAFGASVCKSNDGFYWIYCVFFEGIKPTSLIDFFNF